MQSGLIEETHYPRNPLDVLAQQIVAACALDDWPVDELAAMLRGAANYADLSDDALYAVLDLLAGRYPSDEFAELRPRIIWDRVEGVVRGRPGAQRLAVTSGGTIPDRGLYGVFLPDGTRVGELDEEMVYESRPGETFLLGASTWRIQDITHERVVVTPSPWSAGQDAVLAWRRTWPSPRARPGHGSVSSGRSPLPTVTRRWSDSRERAGSTIWPPPTCSSSSTSRRRQPDGSPTTARSSSSASGTRSGTGESVCSAPSGLRSTPPGVWLCSTGWRSAGGGMSS